MLFLLMCTFTSVLKGTQWRVGDIWLAHSQGHSQVKVTILQ